jgi:sporulation protein YlmC with PRC-barrel domain
MSPEPGRTGDLLGRLVLDSEGRAVGRLADLIVDDDHRVVAGVVVRGRWGRLLGYERDEATGPWVLEQLARHVLRIDSTRIDWADLRF